MRPTTLAAALFTLAVAGCASLRGHRTETGPTLTIHNEGPWLLDLSYRCIENGPNRRLGTVTPESSATFSLRPGSCPTVHLVSQSLGFNHPDKPAFAVVPMLGERSVEVVIAATGTVMRGQPTLR